MKYLNKLLSMCLISFIFVTFHIRITQKRALKNAYFTIQAFGTYLCPLFASTEQQGLLVSLPSTAKVVEPPPSKFTALYA